jgi:hypothetical protein
VSWVPPGQGGVTGWAAWGQRPGSPRGQLEGRLGPGATSRCCCRALTHRRVRLPVSAARGRPSRLSNPRPIVHDADPGDDSVGPHAAARARLLLGDANARRVRATYLDHVINDGAQRGVSLVTDKPRVIRPESTQVRCCDLVHVGDRPGPSKPQELSLSGPPWDTAREPGGGPGTSRLPRSLEPERGAPRLPVLVGASASLLHEGTGLVQAPLVHTAGREPRVDQAS